jgi:ABC-type multidrug transport system fused ATPase/permease subunit
MKQYSIKNSLFFTSLKDALSLLSKKERKKLVSIVLSLFAIVVVDLLGLILLLPIVSISINKSIIYSNKYLFFIYKTFHFANANTFLEVIYAGLLLFFIFRTLTSILLNNYISRFSFDLYDKITTSTLKVYLCKSLSFHSSHNTSEMIRDIKINAFQYTRFIIFSMLTIVSETIVFAIIFFAMVFYNVNLFLLVMVSIIPVVFVFYKQVKNKLKTLGKTEGEIDAVLYENLLVSISGFVDINIYNKHQRFIDVYHATSRKLSNNLSKSYIYGLMPAKIIELSAVIGVLAMLFYSIIEASSSGLILTSISVYIAAAYRLMPSINKILNSFMLLKQYSHLFETIKEIKYLPEKEGLKINKMQFKKSIELKSIDYSYKDIGKKAIDNLSINFPKGKSVGIIGRSGSGKTTLINILLRFYYEESGGIFVDGEKLTIENEDSWRNLIGYVKQDVFIMDGTIAQNIAFELDNKLINSEKLKYAIRIASLYSFIDALPEKENTRVGENGALLSGGQRQRIAIARALYNDSEILIFDEATSALDIETEKEIADAISKLEQENKTLIIIAHRYTTLKECDVIYQMEEGKITNAFSYEDLLKLV